MKNYSEQRGVLSQIIYDAHTGQFKQLAVMHAFASRPVSGEVIEFATQEPNAADTVSSRKVRKTVMQLAHNKRTA